MTAVNIRMLDAAGQALSAYTNHRLTEAEKEALHAALSVMTEINNENQWPYQEAYCRLHRRRKQRQKETEDWHKMYIGHEDDLQTSKIKHLLKQREMELEELHERLDAAVKSTDKELEEGLYKDREYKDAGGWNMFQDINCMQYDGNREVLVQAHENALEVVVKNGTEIVLCKVDNPALQMVMIPRSVRIIGVSAFYNCPNLKTLIWRPGTRLVGSCAFVNCGLTHLIIPDGVLEIEESAFSDCPNLETVYLPSSVVSMGEYVFSNCPSLKEVYISPHAEKKFKAMFAGKSIINKLRTRIDDDWDWDDHRKDLLLCSMEPKESWPEDFESDCFYGMTDGMYGDYDDYGCNDDYYDGLGY